MLVTLHCVIFVGGNFIKCRLLSSVLYNSPTLYKAVGVDTLPPSCGGLALRDTV